MQQRVKTTQPLYVTQGNPCSISCSCFNQCLFHNSFIYYIYHILLSIILIIEKIITYV